MWLPMRVFDGNGFTMACLAVWIPTLRRLHFDKLQRVSHAAIVENKRLGEILAWIKEKQDRQPRFNRVPDGPRRSSQKPGILKNRALQITEAAKSCPKAYRRGWRRCDMVVSAAPAHAPSEAAE
jgi:hypothetical protein